MAFLFFFTVIDATGKLESGVLKGNVKWLGSMSECEEIEAIKTLPDNTTRKLFNGQYCVVALSPTNSSSIFKASTLYCGVDLFHMFIPEM